MNRISPPCDVLVDAERRSGGENMRLDESLLERVTNDGTRSFARIYQWAAPTVSLGYFQNPDESVDPRIKDCDRVKRITGGGAILHHHELTYSCVVPGSHPVRSHPVQLYDLIHNAVTELLSTMGVTALMRKDLGSPQPTHSEGEPFLCFLRSDPRDVVLRGMKILGSAQRRRRGTILQHGSVLLRASHLTPEVPGICDLNPQFDDVQFACRLPSAIGYAISHDVRIKYV